MCIFNYALLFIVGFLQCLPYSTSQNLDCKDELVTFELITGYVLRTETLDTLPGFSQLTDCLNACRDNPACRSVNFETGLCVLLNASGSERPKSLVPSQFPVFTIYAEKTCLRGVDTKKCPKSWAFERVIGYELRSLTEKKFSLKSKTECMEMCLLETEFECRSLNYDNETGECFLSHLDRHALKQHYLSRLFSPHSGNKDYFESNCIEEPKNLCEFAPIKGKILKTVESIHQEIKNIEDCQQLCLDAPYRCFSYNFGGADDGGICRTSHLDSATVTNIEEPYVEIKDAVTYERISCYNVTISCKANEIEVSVKTSKLFGGKIYGKSKPNSCVTDIDNKLEFGITMPYNDLLCDVKQKDAGSFTNDIVIQHHDMVMTTKDFGLSVNCHYDLSNRSVSNDRGIQVEKDFGSKDDEERVHSVTVNAPNVTMRVTDRDGNEVTVAQVGGQLRLLFEISEPDSPYEIFVHELVAFDGADTSDIELIDTKGCPVDISIMSFVEKVQGNRKSLVIPFDAFKFPNSDIVQFRALVTPCIPKCEPVFCAAGSYDGKMQQENSYGKRRRRWSVERNVSNNIMEEELIVEQSIKIMDSLWTNDLESIPQDDHSKLISDSGKCLNLTGLTLFCILFLVAQFILILAWGFVWYHYNAKKRKQCEPQPPFVHPNFQPKFLFSSSTSQKNGDFYSIMKNQHY